eukprot:1186396-Pyramimonas_sp.AAC.1
MEHSDDEKMASLEVRTRGCPAEPREIPAAGADSGAERAQETAWPALRPTSASPLRTRAKPSGGASPWEGARPELEGPLRPRFEALEGRPGPQAKAPNDPPGAEGTPADADDHGGATRQAR